MRYMLESQDWPGPDAMEWLPALNHACDTFEEAVEAMTKMVREDYALIGHSYPYRIVEA